MLAFNFHTKIFWLVTGWSVLGFVRLLTISGIAWRPQWIRKALATSKSEAQAPKDPAIPRPKELEFWLMTEDGEIMLPMTRDVDVAQEMRKRLQMAQVTQDQDIDDELDTQTYDWFRHGGWWGERDNSGEYAPSIPPEDDATSMVSFSTDAADSIWSSDSGWETDSSGRRTPTQENPIPNGSNTYNLNTTLDTAHLAKLLNPRTLEERTEARMLSARLRSQGPVTRARASRLCTAPVLTSTNYRPANFRPSNQSGKLTPSEEAEVLESLIIKFRESRRRVAGKSPNSWQEGAEGLGPGGPLCVVCQSTPRTILAWPCRCLSICEECRVSLAMNNFGTCVCCRQEVVGFSRLYVP